jgi:hemerythrin
MHIRWTNDLSSGIEEIDLQHKELIRQVNAFLTATRKGRGKEEISNLIVFLKEYVLKNFSEEEKHMLNSDYPGYSTHKHEHAMFINDLSDIEKEFLTHGVSSYFLIQVQKKLCNWIGDHLCEVDKKMADYFKSSSSIKHH